MKLGIGYNVWDGAELLERSLLSVREHAHRIVVVYQRVSNFGQPCSPHLESFLRSLIKRGLIDEMICFDTKASYTPEERAEIIHPEALPSEIGSAHGAERGADVGIQFLNEVSKRELSRRHLLEAGCSHYLLMDADEFYLPNEFKGAKELIANHGLDYTVCYMRNYFGTAGLELLPPDNLRMVSFISKLDADTRLHLATPSVPLVIDPTRRAFPHQARITILPPAFLRMQHMSFVRFDIKTKLENTSNKNNFGALFNPSDYRRKFNQWLQRERTNSSGPPEMPPLPHPEMQALFKSVAAVPNLFGIDLSGVCRVCFQHAALKCTKCNAAGYCGSAHADEDSARHAEEDDCR